MTRIEVLAPGALTTIQDLGRPGRAHVGVPRSGAADRASLRLANLLAGNAEGAAALETTLVGPRLRFDGDSLVALTGAPVAARIGERAAPMNRALTVAAGEQLTVGTARAGLRTYVAFAGGIDVPLVLGSAATDVLSGLGPPPLARGDLLSLGTGIAISSQARARPRDPLPMPTGVTELRVVIGPRDDRFTSEALGRLLAREFIVTPASNRVGLRLQGPALDRTGDDELPSEGLVAGAIQVPPAGQPILLLADHPTTGGYPVIAVVRSGDLPLAGQLRPGQRLRFST